MRQSAFKSSCSAFAVIAAILCTAAYAQDAPGPGRAEAKRPAPVMPSPFDDTTESLKNDVLRVNRQAEDLSRQLTRPGYSQVNVYFAVQLPSLLIYQVEISIDGAPGETLKFDRLQSIALLNGSDRVLTANAKPGVHHLHIKVTGQYPDAQPDAQPLVRALDADFQKDQDPAELEFILSSPRYSSRPALHLRQWVPANS